MSCQVVKSRFQQYARCNSYAWKQLYSFYVNNLQELKMINLNLSHFQEAHGDL